jgi:hypothetical protein
MTGYRGLGWGALCLVALLGLSNTADAQPRRGRGGSVGVRFDVHLDLGWYSEFGIGARIDIPIVPDGFLNAGSIEDDFSISPGLEVFFWNYYDYCYYDRGLDREICDDYGSDVLFAVPVMAQWNLYLNERWSIFPEAGLVVIWGDHWRGNHYGSRRFRPDFAGGFGARYHFSARNALLMRVSWPAGFQIGITF